VTRGAVEATPRVGERLYSATRTGCQTLCDGFLARPCGSATTYISAASATSRPPRRFRAGPGARRFDAPFPDGGEHGMAGPPHQGLCGVRRAGNRRAGGFCGCAGTCRL